MTTPATTPVATPSCWQNFTQQAGDTASWMGRQISVIGTTLKDWALRAFAWLSDAFSRLAANVTYYGSQAVQWVKANPQTAAIIGGVTAVGVALLSIFYCCKGEKKTDEADKTTKTDNTKV